METIRLQNDPYIVHEVIEEHIDLAKKIAKGIGKDFPNKVDDLISEAFYGLTDAVNELANGKQIEGELTPYIAYRIKSTIWDFLRNDNLIRIPKEAYRNGTVFEIVHDGEIEESYEDTEKGDIEECTEYLNKTEKKIVLMKMENFSNKDISKALGKSQAWVSGIINRIKEKLS